MHEGAIVRSLLDIAEKIKEDEQLIRVTRIKIIVGKFHQIVEEVMMMHFGIMKKDLSGFEDTELLMIEKDVVIKCVDCGEVSNLTEPVFYCLKCSSPDTDFISGNELYIEKIEGLKD